MEARKVNTTTPTRGAASELLLPCNCGGTAARNTPAAYWIYGVHCTKCRNEVCGFESQAEADAAWNRVTGPAPVTEGAQREAVAELIKAARAMIRSSDAVADSANIGLMDEPIAYLTAVCNYIEQMPASPQQQMQVTDKMVEAAKAVYDDGEWSIGHRLAREMIEAAIRVRP